MPPARQPRLGRHLVEAGFKIALAAQTHHLLGDFALVESSSVGMARTPYSPASD